MATLEYIDVPPGATRLRAPHNGTSSTIRPAPKIVTSIPHPSPPPSPNSISRRRPSLLSSNSFSSPTASLIPQLLLSAALPPMNPNVGQNPVPTTTNPRKTKEVVLLSSKDALSVPIMTTNFKRFITVIGPVFWLQDRIEEIVLWKRGWMRTAVWMAAYSFLCFYPRLILLIPHIALISIILATYPYPANPEADPLYSVNGATSAQAPVDVPPPVTEGSVPWQANIQAIQNLMGAVADVHDLVEPYLYHFRLTPAHISSTRPRNLSASSPRSPYTAHILTVAAVSFFPLLLMIYMPGFPIRAVCLFLGLAPFVVTHPYTQALLPVLVHALVNSTPFLYEQVENLKFRANALLKKPAKAAKDDDSGLPPPLPLSMVLQRVMDDDRLSDECWNSEMREVQLWENERFGGPLPSDSPTIATSVAAPSGSSSGPSQKGWGKQNLRPGERTAWTRGRDGWSGVGSGGEAGSGMDGTGEVSSNLTFSLAPGWRFVESEDWRKDVQCAWSGCGGDPDGWVYTNDAWIAPQPTPYTSGGGSVTRRRRWIRRVWYDPKRASMDS